MVLGSLSQMDTTPILTSVKRGELYPYRPEMSDAPGLIRPFVARFPARRAEDFLPLQTCGLTTTSKQLLSGRHE